MGDELTQAAKDAIAEAVRIVKEDKWDQFLRDRVTKHAGNPPVDPPVDPPKPKDDDPQPPTPPMPPDAPNPPVDEPKRKSAYWGEIFDE